MALIDGGSGGGFDPEEARRKAILDRLARGGQTSGGVLHRAGLEPADAPSAQPTVAEQAGPRDAHDRRSVLERNEQSTMGPFAGAPTPSATEDPEDRRSRLLAATP